jgi:hypothetical protein
MPRGRGTQPVIPTNSQAMPRGRGIAKLENLERVLS